MPGFALKNKNKRTNARMCRHCWRAPVSRSRGLCWSCFYTPVVRDLYEAFAGSGRRGVRDSMGQRPLPQTPVAHAPGSPEKIAELELRAAQGVSLFHPEDA